MDYLVKSIACIALDGYIGGKLSTCRKSLTTIALGAASFEDIYESVIYNRVQDYLQLRVYRVDLNYESVLGPSPTITQVAKGFVDDATMCFDKDLLSEYWLN